MPAPSIFATGMVASELALASNAAVTAGTLYVVITPGAENPNGAVIVCPPGSTIVSQMLGALSLPSVPTLN